LKVFKVADGALVRSFEGHTHHVLSVAWRMNGRTLVSGSADTTMKVWDLKTGEQKRTIQGFGKEITCINFVADSMRVIAACGDRNVRLTNTDGGNNERNYGGSPDFVYTAAISADGKLLMTGGQDGVVRVYDANQEQPLREISAGKQTP
jgi:WD40 repeat protein